VPRGDPKAMADRVIALLSNEAERRRMGEAGRQWASDFDARTMVSQLHELYRPIVRG